MSLSPTGCYDISKGITYIPPKCRYIPTLCKKKYFIQWFILTVAFCSWMLSKNKWIASAVNCSGSSSGIWCSEVVAFKTSKCGVGRLSITMEWAISGLPTCLLKLNFHFSFFFLLHSNIASNIPIRIEIWSDISNDVFDILIQSNREIPVRD